MATWGGPKDHQRRSVPYPAFLQGPISERMKGKEPYDLLLFTSMTGGRFATGTREGIG